MLTAGATGLNQQNPLAADAKAFAALQASPAYATMVRETNHRHALALQALLRQTGGLISAALFGVEASNDAWLIVQHADDDPALQQRYLAAMQQHSSDGQTDWKSYAYLYDRVQANANRPQRYGTQGGCVGKRWKHREPVEDEARLDQRRAKVGLLPIADYEAQAISLGPMPLVLRPWLSDDDPLRHPRAGQGATTDNICRYLRKEQRSRREGTNAA